MKLVKKLLHDPIFHFVLIGSVLFILDAIREGTPEAQDIIEIDQSRIEWIKNTNKKENGYFPDKRALTRLIDNDIKQEIFFREALSIGLEKDDIIIRRRLIEKFTFMFEGLPPSHSPSDDDLLAFYQKNTELFQEEERYSFSHYYFSTDSRKNAYIDADNALQQLTNLASSSSTENQKIGDPFMLPYHYQSLDQETLKDNFGEQFSIRLINSNPPNKDWIGPIKSVYGWHLVKITHRQQRYLPDYQDIKEKVLVKFLDQQRIENIDAMYEKLLAKYQVNVVEV
ncbi:MAG: peptidylprolyl isomerase [Paraglaciecola sp.]|uniref:peptidylprolyl isomerase n=1 Tax=Paraglaciecola sp. TaxID=1920173 RepID=UPI0032999EE4